MPRVFSLYVPNLSVLSKSLGMSSKGWSFSRKLSSGFIDNHHPGNKYSISDVVILLELDVVVQRLARLPSGLWSHVQILLEAGIIFIDLGFHVDRT